MNLLLFIPNFVWFNKIKEKNISSIYLNNKKINLFMYKIFLLWIKKKYPSHYFVFFDQAIRDFNPKLLTKIFKFLKKHNIKSFLYFVDISNAYLGGKFKFKTNILNEKNFLNNFEKIFTYCEEDAKKFSWEFLPFPFGFNENKKIKKKILKNKEKYDVSYISAILDIEREKNAIILNEKFKNSKHFFHFFKPFNVLNSEHESQNIFTNAFLKQEKTICIWEKSNCLIFMKNSKEYFAFIHSYCILKNKKMFTNSKAVSNIFKNPKIWENKVRYIENFESISQEDVEWCSKIDNQEYSKEMKDFLNYEIFVSKLLDIIEK